MKKKLDDIGKKELNEPYPKTISRKEAIKKTAYIAVSAATMMILLAKPTQASASPPAPPPGF